MVVIRRFLLTGLGSPAVTTVAVVLTGNALPVPSPPLASLPAHSLILARPLGQAWRRHGSARRSSTPARSWTE